jgi:hypothetical protein
MANALETFWLCVQMGLVVLQIWRGKGANILPSCFLELKCAILEVRMQLA